jgi:hypothetical protein
MSGALGGGPALHAPESPRGCTPEALVVSSDGGDSATDRVRKM